MKKYFVLVVLTLFTVVGCSSDDCNCKDETIEPIENYSKKVVGNWVLDRIVLEGGNVLKDFELYSKEERIYSNKNVVNVYYKGYINGSLKLDEKTSSPWSISDVIIDYSNEILSGIKKEKIIKLTNNELWVFTDVTRELIYILDIYNPEDPGFVGEEGIKVFKKK